MKFATKEKTKLLDFIIGLECIDKNFKLQLENNFKSSGTTDFYNIYKDFYSEISPFYFEIKKIFISPYYPMLQSLYRKLYNSTEINNYNEFIANIKKLNKEEIKQLVANIVFVEEYIDEEKVLEAIDNINTSGEIKYYLQQTYNKPENYINSAINIFKKIYPIYLKHYEKAEKIYEQKLIKFKEMTAKEINYSVHNLLGSKKLSNLYSNYKGLEQKAVEDIEKNNEEIEIIPLLFGANRVVIITKHNNNDKDLFDNSKLISPIYCIGIDSIKISKKLAHAEQVSKQVLKALSDDTRFDILRMISYGINTNKKLSDLFQISRPAITYQTNILKEVGLIDINSKGRLFVKREQLDDAFRKIESLLNISNREE